ncbi:MAG TPA: glycoside hydrolase family 15 protein [Rhizomicrobium sp.]|nr:glycoside hydrolase family 15 protein [Rhizomicrobium sp.]
MTGRIEDYAVIGDLRSAALVCRSGSIDWLCLPRFDSPACFAALLGKPEHGRWLIAPRGECKISRRYRPGTLILETRFKTKSGEALLTDFMPMADAHSAIVRVVMGVKGSMKFRTELVIRFDYGISVPWVARADEETLTAVAGPHALALRTPAPLEGRDMRTVGEFSVAEGEAVPFSLAYWPSHLPMPLPAGVEASMAETEKFWRGWCGKSKVEGRWKSTVQRSLITLKALSYKPTGGMVAAATTSLPEQLGSTRNWDYRYCWLRDATFILLAFLNAGYTEEAHAWQNWLSRAIAGTPDQIQTMYGVAGERRLEEWTLPWLPGFAKSAPVRIGNAAALQLQLDIYGELADVFTQAERGGLPPVPRRVEIQQVFLNHLARVWKEPDEGIWEIRGPRRHFVHSKVMAWVAFDRAWRGWKAQGGKPSLWRKWKKIADEIHADVLKHGIDKKRGCFVQCYESPELDAALLMIPIVGFLPARDKRVKNTVREIEKRLLWKGLVRRYETGSGVDGLPEGEGAFLACSFWLVDNYVMAGHRKKGLKLFRKLVKLANDVGLLAEEYDPGRKRMLGNFPQAFSHVALVNSAFNLMSKPERKKPIVARHES